MAIWYSSSKKILPDRLFSLIWVAPHPPPWLNLFIIPGHGLQITQHSCGDLCVPYVIEYSVSMESKLLRAGTKSICPSPGPGAEARVGIQQVLRKYLSNEGRREAGRKGPVQLELDPKPGDAGPMLSPPHTFHEAAQKP